MDIIRIDKMITHHYIAIFVSLIVLAFLLQPNKASSMSDVELKSVFHLYSEQQHIGSYTENDMNEVNQIIDELLAEKLEMKPNLEVYVEEVTWVEERVFKTKYQDRNVQISTIKNQLSIVTEALALKVEGETIGYLNVDKDKEDIIKKIVDPFIDAEDERILEESQKLDLDEIAVGDSIIEDITISPSIDIEKTTVSPEEIVSFDFLEQMLFKGTQKKGSYEVNVGDVLSSIAIDFQMTVDDLLDLNPQVDIEDHLQIGMELTVEKDDPLINVSITRMKKEKETMSYDTIFQEDADLWKGESNIIQAGKVGKKEVIYEEISKNEKIESKEVIKEKVLEEKRDKIIVQGTKVVPSRGTGAFEWPTIGGRITSYQGMRWGRFHKGIDIAGPRDYSILAADNGTVSFTGWKNGYGNTIEINHNNGYTTHYAHLASIDVRVGEVVTQGSKIGVMGSTGRSTGIHLDFEVYLNGNLVDPMDVLPKR